MKISGIDDDLPVNKSNEIYDELDDNKFEADFSLLEEEQEKMTNGIRSFFSSKVYNEKNIIFE